MIGSGEEKKGSHNLKDGPPCFLSKSRPHFFYKPIQ